jgi:hypothetical protein
MNFVHAHEAAGRKTGQIKLHPPEDFDGMRKAGRLTAPRRDDRSARQARLRFRSGAWRLSRAADVSRLPQVDLHLDQSRRLPRHSRRQAAARRATSSIST